MNTKKNRERGGAQLKFLIVMLVIGSSVYAGYLYVPVAFRAYQYKDLMQHYADVAAAQGYPATWAGDQLTKSTTEYEIPSDVVISPSLRDSRVEIRVQYTEPVNFPGYTYNYEFDQTVRSTAFLTFK